MSADSRRAPMPLDPSALATAATLVAPGRRLLGERFLLLRRLGQGSFGVVHEAEDLRDGGCVALKVLSQPTADWLHRFKREFRGLQGLSHPNLVVLDELFGHGDEWFFTMELVQGVHFIQHVRPGLGRDPKRASLESQIQVSRGSSEPPRAGAHSMAQPASPDQQRLRSAARQLFDGLASLHAAGKVHRDVKPSNVLLTAHGRLVLIDFGLIFDVDQGTEFRPVGTPAYMAPEQAASAAIGPSADLYAAGVMLYEALTGTLPFQGRALQILIDKQTRPAAPLSSIVPGVPRDLEELCQRLLQIDPALRPSAVEASRLLEAARQSTHSTARLSSPATAARTPARSSMPFVGRAAELSQLERAFAESREGKPSAVLVTGESGMGKTELVRQFTNSIIARCPQALVLEGRCHEREAIPYKAIDGVVEALGSRLARMDGAEVKSLLPTRRALLGRLFPSLLRVPALELEAAKNAPQAASTPELRQRAFLELRELFLRVALDRPVLLVVDDLQWADPDGLHALHEILRPPEAPPLTFIGLARANSQLSEAQRERLQASLVGAKAVELGPLSSLEAHELTSGLLGSIEAGEGAVERIVAESQGHPLFVHELARHAGITGSALTEIRLDDVIWSRVAGLAAARELVEVLAVAGKPLSQAAAAAAAGLSPMDYQRHAAALRVGQLVRTSGPAWSDAIDTYHDRVRETALAHLGSERLRALHEAIAHALEATREPEPEALARHFRAAGQPARAAAHAAKAGDQAFGTFAFERAAEWYEQALHLCPPGHATHRELRVQLGNALSMAGRGALAAEQFESAAAQSPAAVALDLRRRAAEELLGSGHFERGFQAGRQLLAQLGVRIPTTRLGTYWALLSTALLLRLRGMRFVERSAAQIDPIELLRIDTCWSLARAVSFADTMLGFAISQRGLLLALRAGNVDRIVPPLAASSSHDYGRGRSSAARGAPMLHLALRLVRRTETIRPAIVVGIGAGLAHYFLGRFRPAARRFAQALSLAEDSHGTSFERAVLNNLLLQSLGFLGRFRELCTRQRRALEDAELRGDLYSAVSMQIGYANFIWLVEDRPDLAQAALDRVARTWRVNGFHVEHYKALLARTSVYLYTGDVERAYSDAQELLERTRRSLLWRLQIVRLRTSYAHGSAVLALLQRGGSGRRGLLRQLQRDRRQLERERAAWIVPFAEMLRAGEAVQRGQGQRAVVLLQRAAQGFAAHHLMAFAAAARERCARLHVSSASRSDAERAIAWLRQEGVVRPERLLDVLLPEFSSDMPPAEPRPAR